MSDSTAAAGGKDPAVTTPDPSVAEAAAAAKPSRRGRTIVISTVAGAFVLLGGWASLPWWAPSLPGPLGTVALRLMPPRPVDPQVAALTGQVESLSAVVARLQAQQEQMQAALRAAAAAPAPAPVGGERLTALEAMVADLADKAPGAMAGELQALSARVEELAASRAPASALLTLGDRVTEVEALARKAVSRQDRALALLLAVVQLREALDAGRPYAVALKTVQAVAPATLDVKTLTADFAVFAEDGLTTQSVLEQSLSEQAADIVRAAALPEDTTAWWSQALEQIAGLISIRRLDGPTEGDSVATIVSRAQTAMAEGSLSVAVDELSRLTGRPAQEADGWMQRAKARLAADAVTGDLVNEGLARLAAETSVGQTPGLPTGASSGNGG
ncbi:COG4223 family protein [Novispirillum itersonii]|uniref:Uncharacterized protein n=1 Tax=Novispirillum itersonii TaxID=189 RepID=A0A7X0DM69_NOVIT|nr:mitofilin family membrane protein [Novispirillum itersonii]MBB6210738.1 hypothetical protein [Novispirillum itersonii]